MAAPIPEGGKTPYVFLGRSGLKVSNLCLGTMTFGENQYGRPGNTAEDESHRIINRYTEWGGNFLDTANVYGRGISESIIGKWLERQPRDNFVIATKVRGQMDPTGNVNNSGLSRRHITDSIDRSLQRLHTDFVDLYQTHMYDDAVDIEDTLRTLDDLVRVGKIRYIGVSNVTGWQLQKLVGTIQRLGLNPIISFQQQYSLLVRESELEPFQVCKSAGIGVLPWSPLKGGALTGKVRRGVTPTEGRVGWMAEREAKGQGSVLTGGQYDDKTFNIIEAAEAIGKKHGRTTSQVSLRWLLQKDVVSSVIFGATSLAQLDDNMGANGWSLTEEEMKQLDDLSTPNTPYPYEFVARSNGQRVNKAANDYYVKSVA
jgi:aryl-alcohol dehydrogenase-like predicted oxidoreductase